jgi:hypothetical protein
MISKNGIVAVVGLAVAALLSCLSQAPQYPGDLPDLGKDAGGPIAGRPSSLAGAPGGGGDTGTRGVGGTGGNGGTDGEAGTAVADGSVGGATPTLDAANHNLDAEQPVGGCGTPGRSCVGNMLNVCDSNGVLTGTSCANGCSPTRLDCYTCPPNRRSCEGSSQVVCNAEGTGTTTMACTSGCDATTGECRDCQPSTTWCNGDVLRQCTAAGEQRDLQTCEHGCNSQKMACNLCRPGSRTCMSGNTLVICNADGTATASEACSSGCNVGRLACNACAPGTKMCATNTLRTCRSDGSGYNEQSCPNGCSGERCNACNPSQGRTCEGTSVRQCMSDGSGFQLTPCNRGCAGGNCCTGNTEAVSGTCRACGGNNQPCCASASPSCNGSLVCQSDRCVQACGPSDGQCPSGCSFSQDSDCKKPNGEACDGGNDCQSGNCVSRVCCNSTCADGCRSCTVSGKVGACSAPNAVEVCGNLIDDDCRGGAEDGCLRIRVFPETIDFGALPPGGVSETRFFTVVNQGNTTITLNTHSLSEGPAGENRLDITFADGTLESRCNVAMPMPSGFSCAQYFIARATKDAPPGLRKTGRAQVLACPEGRSDINCPGGIMRTVELTVTSR